MTRSVMATVHTQSVRLPAPWVKFSKLCLQLQPLLCPVTFWTLMAALSKPTHDFHSEKMININHTESAFSSKYYKELLTSVLSYIMQSVIGKSLKQNTKSVDGQLRTTVLGVILLLFRGWGYWLGFSSCLYRYIYVFCQKGFFAQTPTTNALELLVHYTQMKLWLGVPTSTTCRKVLTL